MKIFTGPDGVLFKMADDDMRDMADIFIETKKVGDRIGVIKAAIEASGFESFKTPIGNYAFKRRDLSITQDSEPDWLNDIVDDWLEAVS
jgi:hypothetical protein